jgi:hypothetical protein
MSQQAADATFTVSAGSPAAAAASAAVCNVREKGLL